MAVMKRNLTAALCALALGAGAALAGCGGSATKTTSVAGTAEATQTTPTSTTSSTPTTTAAATTTTTSTTAPAPTSTAGGTAAPGVTHTAPEPAFTHEEPHGEGLSAAVAELQAHGYTPNDTSQYHANQTLQVLVGTKSSSSDGYDQQAFFFLSGRYIGTDTKEPSASVKVLAQSDTEVTLAYPLYRQGDPLSSPSAGEASVRFQLDDGKLVALDPIPPANSASAPSRY